MIQFYPLTNFKATTWKKKTYKEEDKDEVLENPKKSHMLSANEMIIRCNHVVMKVIILGRVIQKYATSSYKI